MITVDTDDADLLVEQAGKAAGNYATAAFEFMNLNTCMTDWSSEAKATFMSGFMQAAALDFQSAAIVSAGQHIARAITEASDAPI